MMMESPSICRRRQLRAAALVASWLALPLVAAAQPADTAALEQITTLNQEAATAFDTYAFKNARKKLYRALQVASRAGLGSDPKLATTYVLLGVAYVSGSNDLYRGLHYFVRALRLDPKARIPKKLRTPQLVQMFKTARRTLKAVGKPPRIKLVAGKKGPRPDAGKKPKAKGQGLIHTPIDTAKRGYPIPVKARSGLDIQAHRIYLFYRHAGTVKFFKIPMKKGRGVYRAAIPANATHGRYVHYYIQAQDQRGRLAGSMGSARSPNVVIMQ
jgi:hypothetical protein